tara:strand:- start:293 stop:775 length:483 start_codon:yes stop_codon:yes gene_type:complete
MGLDFCSIEEAWGEEGLSHTNSNSDPVQSKEVEQTSSNDVESYDLYNQHAFGLYDSPQNSMQNDTYTQSYCESILNHIQSCEHCKRVLMKKLCESCYTCDDEQSEKVEEEDTQVHMSTSVLTRKNDNMAYIPFNLEPEVFNVLLFSILSITLLTLFDKHK